MRKKNVLALTALVTSCWLTACSTVPPEESGEELISRKRAVVRMGTCVTIGPPDPEGAADFKFFSDFATPLLAKGIDMAVDKAVDILEGIAEPEDRVKRAWVNEGMGRKDLPECIQFVYGEMYSSQHAAYKAYHGNNGRDFYSRTVLKDFSGMHGKLVTIGHAHVDGAKKPKIWAWRKPGFYNNANNEDGKDGVLNRLYEDEILIAEDPDIFFEARIVYADAERGGRQWQMNGGAHDAVRLEPVFLSYREALEVNGWFAPEYSALSATFWILNKGVNPEVETRPTGGITIDLGKWEPGRPARFYSQLEIEGNELFWKSDLPSTPWSALWAAAGKAEAESVILMGEWREKPEKGFINKAAGFVADTFVSSETEKDRLAKLARATVIAKDREEIEAQRRTAAKTELEARRTGITTYTTALTAAYGALESFGKADIWEKNCDTQTQEPVSKQLQAIITVYEKLETANAAAIGIGRAKPFPLAFDLASTTPETIAASCELIKDMTP